MPHKTLHVNVKSIYFHAIANGNKCFEYRLKTNYWRKRLENRSYSRILIKNGYPKKDDTDRIIERPWLGYEEQTITHKHFGTEPVDVFAILV